MVHLRPEDSSAKRAEAGKESEPVKKFYTVTLPMAGHLVIEIEASSPEEAVAAATELATLKDVECWETLYRFNKGNVCYCPQPWEVTVHDVETEEELDVDLDNIP